MRRRRKNIMENICFLIKCWGFLRAAGETKLGFCQTNLACQTNFRGWWVAARPIGSDKSIFVCVRP